MEAAIRDRLNDLKRLARQGTIEEQIACGYAALESIGLEQEEVEALAQEMGLDGECFALSVAVDSRFRGIIPIPTERTATDISSPMPPTGPHDGFAERDRIMLSVVKALLEKVVSDRSVHEAVQSQDADHKEMFHRLVEAQKSLDGIQGILDEQRTVKQWYTPVELAELLGKSPYTVREWCRFRRINARKRPTGRGDADEWEISHEEVERYKNHGLLPIPAKY